MQVINPKIEESWKKVLINDFNSDYFLKLKQVLVEEQKKYTIYIYKQI